MRVYGGALHSWPASGHRNAEPASDPGVLSPGTLSSGQRRFPKKTVLLAVFV